MGINGINYPSTKSIFHGINGSTICRISEAGASLGAPWRRPSSRSRSFPSPGSASHTSKASKWLQVSRFSPW